MSRIIYVCVCVYKSINGFVCGYNYLLIGNLFIN